MVVESHGAQLLRLRRNPLFLEQGASMKSKPNTSLDSFSIIAEQTKSTILSNLTSSDQRLQ